MPDRVTAASILKVKEPDGTETYRWRCRTNGVAVSSEMTWPEYKNCRASLLRAFPEVMKQYKERKKRWKEKGE